MYDLLIVDDHAGIRCLLSEAFCQEGYRVELAASGTEALQKVCTTIPLLILLDNKMPGISGLETLKEIRKINKEVPVIMLTAAEEAPEIISEAKKLGVYRYISKPFDLQEIRCLVRGLMDEFSKSYLREIV